MHTLLFTLIARKLLEGSKVTREEMTDFPHLYRNVLFSVFFKAFIAHKAAVLSAFIVSTSETALN